MILSQLLHSFSFSHCQITGQIVLKICLQLKCCVSMGAFLDRNLPKWTGDTNFADVKNGKYFNYNSLSCEPVEGTPNFDQTNGFIVTDVNLSPLLEVCCKVHVLKCFTCRRLKWKVKHSFSFHRALEVPFKECKLMIYKLVLILLLARFCF